MNAEDLIKSFDPEEKIQEEMYKELNILAYGKPVMFFTIVMLNYMADWLHQLTENDMQSRVYIAELISDFSAHINRNLEVKPEDETEH